MWKPIEWSDALSVGVAALDDEHKTLVEIFNNLGDLISQGQRGSELMGVVRKLHEYAEVHFAHEERLFQLHGYPDEKLHTAQHQAWLSDLQKLETRIAQGEPLRFELFRFLQNWILRHIAQDDMRYRPFLEQRL